MMVFILRIQKTTIFYVKFVKLGTIIRKFQNYETSLSWYWMIVSIIEMLKFQIWFLLEHDDAHHYNQRYLHFLASGMENLGRWR